MRRTTTMPNHVVRAVLQRLGLVLGERITDAPGICAQFGRSEAYRVAAPPDLVARPAAWRRRGDPVPWPCATEPCARTCPRSKWCCRTPGSSAPRHHYRHPPSPARAGDELGDPVGRRHHQGEPGRLRHSSGRPADLPDLGSDSALGACRELPILQAINCQR